MPRRYIYGVNKECTNYKFRITSETNTEYHVIDIDMMGYDVTFKVDKKTLKFTADVNQFNQYRVNIIERISQTGDASILQRIHFVGHKTYDDNTIGEEIKIEFEDAYGNMTDYPYELDRVRIYLYKLMKLGKKILEYNL